MNKYYQAIINTSGDAKALARAQVLDSAGSIVTIYADDGGTRFTDSSGANVNYCEADSTGMVEFYWTAASGQTLQILDSSGTLERAVSDFANNFSTPELTNVGTIIGATVSTGHLGTFTGTTIADNQPVKPAIQALETAVETKTTAATLAATGGAALVGANDASSGAKYTTVQGFITYLLSSVGSAIVGFINSATGAVARTTQSKLRERIDAKDYGCAFDNSTNDDAAIALAMNAAAVDIGDALGNTLHVPNGNAITAAPIAILNRVQVQGVNKRGSIFKADAAHSGPVMFTVVNGTASMFDNTLSDLTVNCNDVAGLNGILSDAWQEGGGLKNVLIQKFRGYGVKLQSGYGGASFCRITDCEIFGSNVSAASAGILVAQISSIGSFILIVKNTSIVGDATYPIVRGIDIVKDSTNLSAVHFEDAVSGVYLDGVGSHVLENVTGGPTVTNVVEIASTFTGSLTMRGCLRAGATNLVKDNRTGGMGNVTWDTDIDISREPPIGPSAIARGTFNGTTVGSPALTYMQGIASITRTSAGLYAVTLDRALPNGNMIVPIVSAAAPGTPLAAPGINLTGTSTFTIQLTTPGGSAVDSNEIKLAVFGA